MYYNYRPTTRLRNQSDVALVWWSVEVIVCCRVMFAHVLVGGRTKNTFYIDRRCIGWAATSGQRPEGVLRWKPFRPTQTVYKIKTEVNDSTLFFYKFLHWIVKQRYILFVIYFNKKSIFLSIFDDFKWHHVRCSIRIHLLQNLTIRCKPLQQ